MIGKIAAHQRFWLFVTVKTYMYPHSYIHIADSIYQYIHPIAVDVLLKVERIAMYMALYHFGYLPIYHKVLYQIIIHRLELKVAALIARLININIVT